MKIEELIKKPISIVVENNISDDMIFPSETISSLIKKITSKLNAEYFLFVYVDSNEDRKIKAVINLSDVQKLVEIISENSGMRRISDLKLEDSFSSVFTINISQTIQDLLNVFKQEKTDIIVVKSPENRYMGKVRRNKLLEWFGIMIGNN